MYTFLNQNADISFYKELKSEVILAEVHVVIKLHHKDFSRVLFQQNFVTSEWLFTLYLKVLTVTDRNRHKS